MRERFGRSDQAPRSIYRYDCPVAPERVIKIGTNHATVIALAMFLLAALGGVTLLSFHLRGRALPSALNEEGRLTGALFVAVAK